MMKYKDFYAEVNFSDKDKIFYGKLAGIKALISFEGDSVQSLETAFQEAVDDYLELCQQLGQAPEKTCSGNITLRVEPQEHVLLSQAAKKADQSLNRFIAEAAQEKAKQLL